MTEKQWLAANEHAGAGFPRLFGLWLLLPFLLLLVAAAFLGESARFWQAYWVNFLYWSALAQAGVVLVAVVRLANGRWGGSLIRLGLLQVGFIPVSLVLFLGIILGSSQVVPWIAHPVPEKAWWLDQSFFLWRNGLALLTLAVADLVFAYFIIRPEAGILAERGVRQYPALLTRNWRGGDDEWDRSQRVLSRLSPILVILYALVYSLIGFDMVMSLDPHWYSTLFGAYYFITTLYLGIAALAVIGALLRKPLGVEDFAGPKQFHDLGKLLFAFCLLAGDFFWSQFLVIWYGDLPEEINFILHRIQNEPWHTLAYVVLFGGFVIPFVILINRKVKQVPITLAAVACLVLLGGLAERIFMVVPSLHPETDYPFPIGAQEGLVTVAFAGLYIVSLLWLIRRVPLVPAEEISED